MENIYNHCNDYLKDAEIWPGYYKRRFNEFKKFSTLFPEPHFGKTLEIGCGIGYHSAFLSCLSDKVIATDIDLGNMIKHSRGLAVTRKFIERTGIKNIEVMHANAEYLPFESETFDFIYCSYSFQYISDKTKALTEIKRVLKKKGYFFCVLPTASDRIDATIKYYSGVLRKLLLHLTPNYKPKTNNNISVNPKKLRREKLLPPPDDESNNYFSEIINRAPGKWKKLFSANGHKIILEKHSAWKVGKKKLEPSFFIRFKQSLHSSGFILITKNE